MAVKLRGAISSLPTSCSIITGANCCVLTRWRPWPRATLREKASVDNAREFLRRLNGREQTESEPGVYRWREINEGGLSQIELDALEPKMMTVHRLVLRRTG